MRIPLIALVGGQRHHPGSGKSSLVSQALVELDAEHLGHELPLEKEAGEVSRSAKSRTAPFLRALTGDQEIRRK